MCMPLSNENLEEHYAQLCWIRDRLPGICAKPNILIQNTKRSHGSARIAKN